LCVGGDVPHIVGKDEGYNFAIDLPSIRGLQKKLWASKVAKVLNLGISGLSFRSPKTK